MASVGTTELLHRLDNAVADAGTLLARLEPLLAEPDASGPDTGTMGRSVPSSREPWSREVAAAYWDLYFGARQVARTMRANLGLHLPLYDDVYGADALTVVRNTAPSVDEVVLGSVTRELERWVSAARQIPEVDETEPWTPLPRTPGRGETACPYCKTFALRMLRRKGEVRCFFPGCTDSDGNPTRARMEAGRMTGEERLIFGDGMTMGGGG